MSDYRYRPKGNYIFEANWDELLKLTINWKHDLIFYRSDLKFLQQLIEVHYVKLLLQEDLVRLSDLQKDINLSHVRCAILLKRLAILIEHLNNLIADSDFYDSYVFRSEQELFEDDFSECIETLKIIRLMTFSMLKNVLDEDKSKFIWKSN